MGGFTLHFSLRATALQRATLVSCVSLPGSSSMGSLTSNSLHFSACVNSSWQTCRRGSSCAENQPVVSQQHLPSSLMKPCLVWIWLVLCSLPAPLNALCLSHTRGYGYELFDVCSLSHGQLQTETACSGLIDGNKRSQAGAAKTRPSRTCNACKFACCLNASRQRQRYPKQFLIQK